MNIKQIKKGLNGKPIILVGMMGCGKSSVAKLLGKALELEVYDSDALIIQKTGKPIAEIFEVNGEAAFREMEVVAVQEAMDHGGVVSVGGGALVNPGTMSFVKEGGVSVWLDTDLDILARRLRNDNTRPLLKERCLEKKLLSLMEERRALYQRADIHVKNNGKPEEAVEAILKELNH